MKSANEIIRVGICGAGNIINDHCAAMQRVPGIVPVAISSRTLTTARKTAKRWGIKKVHDDHKRVFESSDVDLVLVATPNYQHAPIAIEAMKAGKHVLVEKPMALSVAEGKKMIATAKKAGVHLCYGEQLPLVPKFARLIEMANAGDFGDVYMVRQIERHAGPYSPWFFKQKTAGGGALMDLGCHSISVVREIYPDSELEAITGFAKTHRHTQGDVEDFMIVQMHYKGGRIGVVESNWCHLGGMDSITEIFGSKGNGYGDMMKGTGMTTFIEKSRGTMRAGDDGWRNPPFDPVYEHGNMQLIQGVADTIRTGAPQPQTGQDGLAILRIMQAAYKSAERGSKPVKFNG